MNIVGLQGGESLTKNLKFQSYCLQHLKVNCWQRSNFCCLDRFPGRVGTNAALKTFLPPFNYKAAKQGIDLRGSQSEQLTKPVRWLQGSLTDHCAFPAVWQIGRNADLRCTITGPRILVQSGYFFKESQNSFKHWRIVKCLKLI